MGARRSGEKYGEEDGEERDRGHLRKKSKQRISKSSCGNVDKRIYAFTNAHTHTHTETHTHTHRDTHTHSVPQVCAKGIIMKGSRKEEALSLIFIEDAFQYVFYLPP